MESQDQLSRQIRHRSLKGLLFWLALVPVIMGSMFLCGQLALLVSPTGLSADTRSRLDASYLPWAYDLIPPINIAAIMKDILKDEQSMGTAVVPVTVVTGVFWEPPTPTTSPGGSSTGTPYIPTITLTPQPPQVTPSSTSTTQGTGTSTPTLRPTATPTRTLLPTFAPTRTSTQPPPATATNTAPPPPATPTNTKVPATPTTPAATLTPTTAAPSATPVTPSPVVPTDTPVVPTAKPIYAPVLPIAGGSAPVDGGCQASFGYRNDNPKAVDIPLGPLNYLSDENAIAPDQPTYFQMGEVSNAFSVVWTSGEQIIWTLDGRSASASWCQP